MLLAVSCLPGIAGKSIKAAAQEQADTDTEPCVEIPLPEDPYLLDPIRDRNLLNQAEGLIINRINIYSLDVFNEADPRENNLIYRTLNIVHIDTNAYVIRHQLLFHEGEPLDIRVVYETERVLRSMPYLAEAVIVPETICGDTVNIAVITRDSWTLQPSANAGLEGGEKSSGAGISETNLLGTGNSVSLNYSKNGDKSRLAYSLISPHIMGSRWQSNILYAPTSDGLEQGVSLARPFYSLDAKWSAGFDYNRIKEIMGIKEENQTINEYKADRSSYQIYAGFSGGLKDTFTNHWIFSLNQEAEQIDETINTAGDIPENSTINFPAIAFSRTEDRYTIFRNLNQIFRTEDIFLGQEIFLKLGYGRGDQKAEQTFIHISGRYTDAISIGDHHLARIDSGLKGRWMDHTGEFKKTIFSNRLSYNHLSSERHRWYFGLSYDIGLGLSDAEFLTFEKENLLRGYPFEYQQGNRRFIAAVERRYFSELHLFNLIRAGGVVFVDAGKAWESGHSNEANMLADFGLGLRIAFSKSSGKSVLHIDIARPLVDRDRVDSYQLTFKGYTYF